jgi:hypothetical protein
VSDRPSSTCRMLPIPYRMTPTPRRMTATAAIGGSCVSSACEPGLSVLAPSIAVVRATVGGRKFAVIGCRHSDFAASGWERCTRA